MAELQDLLAQVNHAAVSEEDEGRFLQTVCDLAIARGKLALVYIARPDTRGIFRFLAAGGCTTYIDGLLLTIDPNRPEGQGPTGRVWRDGEALFNNDFSTPILAPWRLRAQALGLKATAVLPVDRRGERFAVLALCRADDVAFAPEMQMLLTELARDVSRGLDAIAQRADLRHLSLFNALRVEILEQSAEAADDRAFYGQACRLVVDRHLFPWMRIGAYDADARFETFAASGDTGDPGTAALTQDPDTAGGNAAAARAWREERPVFVQRHPSTAEDTERPADGAARELDAIAAIPLRKRGAMDAVLVLPCSDAQAREDATHTVARELARTLEQGLEDLQRRQQVVRLQGLYRALMYEGEVLLLLDDEQDMLRKTCRALTRETPFHAVWIARPDTAGRMVCLAQAGIGAQAIGRMDIRLSGTQHAPLVVRAWMRERIVFNNDHLADPHLVPWRDFLTEHRWHAALAAPVRRNGAIWATMAFVSPERNVFDTQTIELCQRVADLLGHGLDELDLRALLIEQQRGEAYRARHDALTGLPNRFALEQHVAKDIGRAKRSGTMLALGLIDLDDFKPVNDAYGHAAGDELLRQLTGRLQSLLRPSDLLARLGGDEFVLVLEDLDPNQALHQLRTALTRLHVAVETPFDLGQGRQVSIGMSSGLSLYPTDGDDLDALLRKADAAMYTVKMSKVDRTSWWTIDAAIPHFDAGGSESWDAYGTDAAEILRRTRAQWDSVSERFVVQWHAETAEHPDMRAILDALTVTETASLRENQVQHLLRLLDPQTTSRDIDQAGAHVGRVHALCGVPVDMMVSMFIRYQDELRRKWVGTISDPRQRSRMLHALQERSVRDLQSELRAHGMTIKAMLAPLSRSLAPATHQPWAQTVREELALLARVPGMVLVLIAQPDAHGVLELTYGDGTPQALEVVNALRADQSSLPVTDAQSPQGQGIIARTWRSAAIQHTGAVLQDPGLRPWHTRYETMGVRSLAGVPVLDAAGRPVAVLALFGAYPNQFSASWAQDFLHGLQSRWQALAGRHDKIPELVLPLGQAQARRAALFGGGLQMWMQPVVELTANRLRKVEALARLVLPSGEVISPGGFLPLLGGPELRRLFEQGLTLSLQALADWQRRGLTLEMAVNLPPSLLDDDSLPQRVQALMDDAAIEPTRLTLELLETESLGDAGRWATLGRLHALGIKLAIDDLGSAYSSLDLLRRLPIQVLKIDQALVLGTRTNPLRGLPMLASLLQIGHDLDLEVVIEGLETADLIDMARILEVPLGQGYGLAKPMPARDIPAWAERVAAAGERGPHTALGALTYHWLAVHRHVMHTGSGATCPLTAFFQRHGLGDSALARAHAAFHAGIDVKHNSALLLQELAEQIKAQAPP